MIFMAEDAQDVTRCHLVLNHIHKGRFDITLSPQILKGLFLWFVHALIDVLLNALLREVINPHWS